MARHAYDDERTWFPELKKERAAEDQSKLRLMPHASVIYGKPALILNWRHGRVLANMKPIMLQWHTRNRRTPINRAIASAHELRCRFKLLPRLNRRACLLADHFQTGFTVGRAHPTTLGGG